MFLAASRSCRTLASSRLTSSIRTGESPVFGKNGSAITASKMKAPIPDANRSSADMEKTLISRRRSLTLHLGRIAP